MKATSGTAAERESRDRSRSEDKENNAPFGTETEAVPRVERPEGKKREEPTTETVGKLCLVLARTALQLVNSQARKDVEKITQLISDSSFDAGELFRHVKEIGNCKQVLNGSSDEELAVEGFTNESARNGSRSSVSGALLFKKSVVAVLRR